MSVLPCCQLDISFYEHTYLVKGRHTNYIQLLSQSVCLVQNLMSDPLWALWLSHDSWKGFWDVRGWEWKVAARANIWRSRKGKAFNQEANLFSLSPMLHPLWLLMGAQQPQWHFTPFHLCPIMHLGMPWHLVAVFSSVSAVMLTRATSILLTVTHHKWVYQHTSNRHTPQGL